MYEGEVSMERLDTYVPLYEKVEDHLQHQSGRESLALARRCLYFKVDTSWRKIARSDDWASEIIGGIRFIKKQLSEALHILGGGIDDLFVRHFNGN